MVMANRFISNQERVSDWMTVLEGHIYNRMITGDEFERSVNEIINRTRPRCMSRQVMIGKLEDALVRLGRFDSQGFENIRLVIEALKEQNNGTRQRLA